MHLHPVVHRVTQRIQARSAATRQAYLAQLQKAAAQGKVARSELSCTNLAHGFAAMAPEPKIRLKQLDVPNLAIISAYNDMLSAHQPLQDFPAWIKEEALKAGATAQFAGGVPAMCDGVTQGMPGMELSLFSRDVIAQATAIALAHRMFDAALFLGVCDKIVPGLLIGALAFGHLPAVFVPAGPMTSGLANDDKAEVRKLFAQGLIGRDVLLESEAQSYHAPGTCTFYGTANSNQLMMEVMGLHLPGSAFVNPGTPLREALTRASAHAALAISAQSSRFTPLGEMVDERAIVNAIVGLLASGGSTNHTLHLVAIARAAGIAINWDDFSELSAVVPLLMRVYPNGKADINHFHAAGGMGFVIGELLDAGLLHADVTTILGQGLARHTQEPWLDQGQLSWRDAPLHSRDESVLRPASQPFQTDGGLKLLTGRLGRAVIKVSAVSPERRRIRAPARVFHDQSSLLEAFQRGELEQDMVAVVRFQGPRANGMPELHQLTPALAVLQDRGFQVALITDGRMSGASGKVPAAIHVTPEASAGGPLARVRDGDIIVLDADQGILEIELAEDAWATRTAEPADLAHNDYGSGRELFAGLRHLADEAEKGAATFCHPLWPS
ncbi:phosphogluconate dehydratase [Craterilacuibacter sinensis]|uniref:Phosphogluconate dehydratase n=1 Tax=Craterilacuibacter sinensis TaxID=2686017 RepID=A0A845BI44_9NEIS|nr:phosphogluconate dehydratase [Craterilacuibacter sinensis]MXR36417.1 phosphogluconate dehydratase [Craterilacuibacter sinensis]